MAVASIGIGIPFNYYRVGNYEEVVSAEDVPVQWSTSVESFFVVPRPSLLIEMAVLYVP